MRARPLALIILLLVLAMPDEAFAQSGPDLETVEDLVREHRFGEARTTLQEWWAGPGRDASGDVRARALYLRGVLSDSADVSERTFLAIALDHPQSPEASEALLRLGQSRYARGDVAGAERHFERLAQEYPAASVRGRAAYWLGRARIDRGDVEGGCHALASAAPNASGDRELLAAIAGLREESCRGIPPEVRVRVGDAPAPSRAPAAAPSPRERPRDSGARDPAPDGTFVAEAGIFDTTADAELLRGRLRARGLDVLLLRTGGDARTRVWLGPPADHSTIEERARAARAAGFEVRVLPIDD